MDCSPADLAYVNHRSARMLASVWDWKLDYLISGLCGPGLGGLWISLQALPPRTDFIGPPLSRILVLWPPAYLPSWCAYYKSACLLPSSTHAPQAHLSHPVEPSRLQEAYQLNRNMQNGYSWMLGIVAMFAGQGTRPLRIFVVGGLFYSVKVRSLDRSGARVPPNRPKRR